MKVNWKKSVASALLAAGIFVPSAALGANIPLGDDSFEAFDVSGNGGYAYANLYRPTSAWVGNPDIGPVDGGPNASNWIYNAAYAEGGTKRGAPSDGIQAMHGRSHYSGQESSGVFEAGRPTRFPSLPKAMTTLPTTARMVGTRGCGSTSTTARSRSARRMR